MPSSRPNSLTLGQIGCCNAVLPTGESRNRGDHHVRKLAAPARRTMCMVGVIAAGIFTKCCLYKNRRHHSFITFFSGFFVFFTISFCPKLLGQIGCKNVKMCSSRSDRLRIGCGAYRARAMSANAGKLTCLVCSSPGAVPTIFTKSDSIVSIFQPLVMKLKTTLLRESLHF